MRCGSSSRCRATRWGRYRRSCCRRLRRPCAFSVVPTTIKAHGRGAPSSGRNPRPTRCRACPCRCSSP
ncbi:hypothetical protein EGT67_04535 [Prescottella agglutinans]|uniref:Uncharacterized protein n=1 Tax=Prescottella agglutinans TaxID=1644129 RepID=A0A3S3ECQ4_9NOCA|nr:hypothetical protein EGT67_04535 [Prescottella agglutinans]